MIKALRNKKSQAMVELAIFGSLILIIFGVLLSNMQYLNDQQYVQMESFRRALQIANLGGLTLDDSDVGGASTQLTVMQNRRNVDLSGNYRKGSPQSISASSNVFWSVPAVGSEPNQRVYVRVNEDYSPDLAEEKKGVDDIVTHSETTYTELMNKQEDQQDITTTRQSTLKDTVTTRLYDEDKKELWKVNQGLYRGWDGQYKYNKDFVDTEVQRGRSWETEFGNEKPQQE